jgi:hypothetical protein
MTLDANGNLLVGQTSNYVGESNWVESKSGYVFAANNTGSASNRNWNISVNGSGAGNMDWTVSSTNTGWPNFAYRMTLDASGNLGLGTTSPAAKLDVTNGASPASRLRVGVGAGAASTLYSTLSAGDYINFETNGSERARIDSSGNMGIGTNAPDQKLVVQSGGGAAAYIKIVAPSYDTAYIGVDSSTMRIESSSTSPIGFRVNGSERARIDSSGNFMVGTTTIGAGNRMNVVGNNVVFSPNTAGKDTHTFSTGAADVGTYTIKNDTTVKVSLNAGGDSYFTGGNLLVGTTSTMNGIGSDGKIGLQLSGASGNFVVQNSADNNIYLAKVSGYSNSTFIQFANNGTTVGSVTTNGTITLYNTTSDYRLKNVTGNLTGYKERLMSLQPKQGTWVADGSEFRGFLAHEFAESYSASVTGKKDAVDKNGKPIMQSMQASSSEVMADLVAMVNELITENASLKARLDAANL